MTKEFPTRSSQSITDARASAVVEKHLAEHWVIAEQKPDYHVDYIAEPVLAGELTGHKFAIQQKGLAKAKGKRGHVRAAIAAKHLIYYHEKLRIPVFLFVVDVSAEEGYFVFLQEWIEQNADMDDLRKRARKKKEIGVNVPICFRISDIPALQGEVLRAFEFMNRRHPGRVEDAIRIETEGIQSIDPRWDVNMNYVEGAKIFELNPRERVSLELKAEPAHQELFRELREYGRPLTISDGQFSIVGSPLFEKFKADEISIKSGKHQSAEIEFEGHDGDPFKFLLPVILTRGTVGVGVHGEWPNAPLILDGKFDFDVAGEKAAGAVSVRWAFERWFGLDVRRLPQFERIKSFPGAVFLGLKISHSFLADGIRLNGGHLGTPIDKAPFESAVVALDHISKLRVISEKFGKPIRLNAENWMTLETFMTVEFLHILVTDAGARKNPEFLREGEWQPLKSSEKLNTSDVDRVGMLAMFEREEQNFSIKSAGGAYTVYGTEITVGPIQELLTSVTLRALEPSRSEFIAGRSDTVRLLISGGPKTETHVRFADCIE